MTTAVLTAADGDLPDIPGQPYVSPDDLGSIGPMWQQAVQQQLVPVVAEVYQTSAGVVHAQMVDATQVPTLPSVGSLAAEQYLAAASNTFAEVGDDLWATARSELLDGFEKGESIDQLAARLRASAGLTAKKAVLVARTQVLDASNAGSIATARASGIDMNKGWLDTPDLRTRPTHLQAGTTYGSDAGMIPLGDQFTVGGYQCDRPHDPTLPYGERLNCRCSVIFGIPDDSVDDAVREAESVAPIPGTSGVVEPLPDPYAGDLVSPALPGPDLGLPDIPPATPLTVRPTLAAARTNGAVHRVFTTEYRRITGRDIDPNSVYFEGSVATAREHAEGVLRGLERFPDVPLERVVAFGTGNEYASATSRAIRFNQEWTSPAGRKKYLDALAQDAASGWHPPGSRSPIGIALHEFGHVLDAGKGIHPDLDSLLARAATARDVELAARRAAGELIDAADVADGGGVDGLISREVSRYATKNREELVAEAFADVMTNGETASQLSRDIFSLLEAEYRRTGGVVRAVTTEALPALPSPAAALASRTVPQLRALAKERGITIPPGSKKADIVRLLDEGPGVAPVAAPVVEVPLAKRTVAQLRALAAERKIPVPKGAKKPDIVRLLEAPPLTEAEQRAAVRALARETNTLIEQSSATARVLAEVDELLAKKASAATIREAIADALAEPGQLFAGADPAVLAALRAVASDPVKLRAAITRLGGKAKIKPVSKAGAKVTFDADTMEGVGGIDIPAGARVTVVRRGSTVTLPDGTVMQLEKARVTPVTAPVKKAAAPKVTPEARLRVLFDEEPTDTRRLGGDSAYTNLVTYPDGQRAIEKVYGVRVKMTAEEVKHELDAEELAPLVLRALGIRAPSVVRQGNRLLMEEIDGQVGADIWDIDLVEKAMKSKEGRLLGLADVLMANTDRNMGNWILLPGGRRIAGIDHGLAFQQRGPTGRTGGWIWNGDWPTDLTTYDDNFDIVPAATNLLNPADLAIIRERLEALRPAFEQLGRLDWYNDMMGRLAVLTERARGKRRTL